MVQRTLAAPGSSFFLLGPRGTGKTTWIGQRFPTATVYDLLRPDEHVRLARDPAAFGRECEALPEGSWIVVDEVQRVPALLDEVQRLMTARGQRFVLSGSSARKLRRGGANLLAGRAEIRNLFPFTQVELGFERDLESTLEHGQLPLAVTSPRPRAFLKAYVETYLREEVLAEALVRQVGPFARFLEVAARVNGQVVNVTGLARDAQVARPTVQNYFQILVDTLIASWLPAWRAKKSVKQVAHPKLYLFDCGVARHLAGLGHLPVHPEERGCLFETFLLHELRAHMHYSDIDAPIHFWRTHDGTEVDFVVETRHGLVAIEAKSSTRWDPRFGAGLARFRAEHHDVHAAWGVYCGAREIQVGGLRVLPWKLFLQQLAAGVILSGA
jgi:predicted AAA+ superfamily ATPase